MKKLKILIVEDDKTTAYSIAEQIKKLGYEVSGIFDNEEEAMKRIEQELPDLIVMDIMLKGTRTGVDTAMEIYKKAEIPVIFISAPGKEKLVTEAKFIQNSVFLSKPFDMKKLGETIETVESDILKRTPEYIENERIKALYRYEILDTPEEGNFDRITRLAARIFKVPVVLVSIVDKDRIWFKSRYRFPEKQVSRNPELSLSKFLSSDFFQIASKEENPFVLVDPKIAHDMGFYFHASAPLLTKDGHNLGSLCILDKEQRNISTEEKEILIELAAIVMDEMELRLAARRSFKLQREFLNTAVHDLKNPLSGILSLSDLIKQKEGDKETIRQFNDFIMKSAKKMLHITNELMETALIELNNIKLDLTKVNIADLASEVVAENQPQAKMKNQSLKLNIKGKPYVNADATKIREVFDNLISNAIKYSPNEKSIEVNVKEESGKACFEVKDEGQGLTENDKKKLFGKFTRLSAQPTGGEISTGLGLSIVKSLVEMHGGKVKAESEGKNRGSSFEVELPLVS